ncbi:PHP domain-containing protein [Halocatena salina]|uniref:PHP domain-containing protein n=1 Tax=Halocatena salina TaxID=2934340 RepID=A0A8U0A526_9EURY|nr:PHP domain-containing protein [Halocatena salina]UPM44134.1 PHP domain-containing protein [Halocatena salina]
MLSVELHTHSDRSYDGRDPIDMLLTQAEAIGLDAVAVTDHDQIDASLKASKLAPEYGLIGIPGAEITSTAGHVLGLGIEERVPSGLTFTETVERIHDLGGIAVVPHPFQGARHGVAPNVSCEQLARADAIEVYNSRLLTGRSNRKAKRFAADRKLPMTAGSDAHIAEMVGQAITHVGSEKRTIDSILQAIADGETTVVGERTPWRISLRQAGGAVKRRIKYAAEDFFTDVGRGLL